MFGLKDLLQGAIAQVNPFDGGKDFKSTMRSKQQSRRIGKASGGAIPREVARPQGQQGMQPFGPGYEDDYTAADRLGDDRTSNQQVTRNGLFLQSGNPSLSNDLRQRIALPTMGQAEDDAMVMGQQGFVPMNADVAHFPRGGRTEDDYLVDGPQGPVPMNADVARFRY